MGELLRKLGWREGAPACVLGAPAALAQAVTPPAGEGAPRWVLAFAPDRAALRQVAPKAIALYPRTGWLWFAYPKKAGRIVSDLSRDEGWEPVESMGFLGVAQVSLDQDWSALRFRYRDEIAKLTRKAND